MKKNRFLLTAMTALALSLVMAMSGCTSLSDFLGGGLIGGGFKGGSKAGDAFSYDAGNLRNVRKVSDDGIPKSWLSVSKDGQSLLYCEQEVDFDPDRNTNYNSSRIIYLKNTMVFTKMPLVESYNYAPAWYENGTNFVYITRNQNGTTQLVKSSTSGGKTFVTRNPIGSGNGDNNPSVRDGIIACDVYINGSRQIVTLRDNGSELIVLGRGSQPSWHPTENKLVFTRDGGIWEMDIETTQVTQLYGVTSNDVNAGLTCGKPSYTGDGKHIIFVKRVKVGSNIRRHLYGMNSQGNNITELAGGNVDVWAPGCGGGNEVFFISGNSRQSDIWSALVNLN